MDAGSVPAPQLQYSSYMLSGEFTLIGSFTSFSRLTSHRPHWVTASLQ
jgi:hypothetical protein